MAAFHPTLSPIAFATYLWRARKAPETGPCLEALFPEQQAVLVDSGRSAFALALDALDLKGTTLIMPAYVCDAFYPVLRAYNIRPLFLDVDAETYQPPISAYTKEVLSRADAALLVATYGKRPDEAVIALLQEHGKPIIEDYAMRSPLLREPLAGNARIYSLPKTIPVPDGGLAVLPRPSASRALEHGAAHSSLKNVLKLLPGIALCIAALRTVLGRVQTAPSWDGIQNVSALTQTIFAAYCIKEYTSPPGPFPYCYPLRVNDPARTASKLMYRGIHAERIWNRPIVANPDVQTHYGFDPTAFPETRRIASEIVCAPFWQIKDEAEYQKYTSYLEQISAHR